MKGFQIFAAHMEEVPKDKVSNIEDLAMLKDFEDVFQDDPGGYRGPPTFSKWLKTVFWPFWQFTIFSRFSLPGPF
jgi:hypothetical protein